MDEENRFPCTKIKCKEDIQAWKESPAYHDIRDTFLLLFHSVKSKARNPVRKPKSATIQKLLHIFTQLNTYLSETEVVPQSSCFSNRGFCVWFFKVNSNKSSLLSPVTENEEAIYYFIHSFGNPHRVDFGTGHEFNFLAFVTCLLKLGVFFACDASSIVLDVFWSYWELLFRVQEKFRLAPAGSRGAWGVDDFVALPFVFGASQLVGSADVTPASVVDEGVSSLFCDRFSYCMGISHLYRTKRGCFESAARVLHSLSAAPGFEAISDGMVKMYFGEVVEKFFVVQQFGFGELLKWENSGCKADEAHAPSK